MAAISLPKHSPPFALPTQARKPHSHETLPIIPRSTQSQFYGLKLSCPSSLSSPLASRASGSRKTIVAKETEGSIPPDFKLKDQDGRVVSLSQFRGKPVVVYFYPADETPGCTKQAFKEKYKLPFTLLSDEGNKVRKEWGVPADLFGTLPGRQTYVLDKNGVVCLIYNNQ